MIFRRKKDGAGDVATEAAWQVRESRFHDSREGLSLDIAGRVAICPRGHKRAIPTRFDTPVSELRCPECRRAYAFPAEATAPAPDPAALERKSAAPGTQP